MGEKLELKITADDKASPILFELAALAEVLGLVGSMLSVGLEAAKQSAIGLGNGLLQAMGETLDAEQIMTQTNAIIKATGGAAGMTAVEVANLADSFAATTTFSDDAVQQAENMLLTYTNIGEDVFPTATEAAVDMAAALKTDLISTSRLVGQALNDPIKGLALLEAAGINLSAEQTDVINSLMATGDVAGAQKVLLEQLSGVYGGSAAAQADTFGGRLMMLNNRLTEAAEGIGTKLLPIAIEFFDNVIAPAIPVIEELAEAFGTFLSTVGKSDFGQAYAELFKALANNDPQAFTQSLDALGAAIDQMWTTTIQPALVTLFRNIGLWIIHQAPAITRNLGVWALAIGQWLLTKLPPQVRAGFLTAFNLAGDIGGAIQATLTPTLAKLQQAFVPFVQSLAELGQAMTPFLTQIRVNLEGLLPIVQIGLNMFLEETQIALIRLTVLMGGIAAGILNGITYALAVAMTILQMAIDGLVMIFQGLKTSIAAFMKGISAILTGDWAGLWTAWVQGVEGALQILGGLWVTFSAVFLAYLTTLAAAIGGFILGVIGYFLNLSQALPLIADLMTAIQIAIVNGLTTMTTVWQTGWNSILTIATTLWAKIQATVSTKVMEMTGGLQGVIINTINWLRSQVDTFYKIGVAWFEGITAGILLKVTYLKDAVVNSIKETIEAARNTLGISSPSRVFAQVGEQIMAGMAEGIAGSVQLPQAAFAQSVAGLQTRATTTNVTNVFNQSNSVRTNEDVELLARQVAAYFKG